MTKGQTIFVTYSQVAVFQPDLENPFNNWLPSHVLQGFSWRPGSVTFMTLEEDGDLRVKLQVKEHFDALYEDTTRAIRVPFNVVSGQIEVASISEGFCANLPSGEYSLYFETGKDNNGMWCILSFVKDFISQAEILKIDDDLHPGKELIMDTIPAL
jgi:hypothetical protein